jgi:hypothetical protein
LFFFLWADSCRYLNIGMFLNNKWGNLRDWIKKRLINCASLLSIAICLY